jgi:hypothetical protein
MRTFWVMGIRATARAEGAPLAPPQPARVLHARDCAKIRGILRRDDRADLLGPFPVCD